jgi:hypothetical protein
MPSAVIVMRLEDEPVMIETCRSPYNRPRRAQRGSKGIALLIPNLVARGFGWSALRPGRFISGKYPVPIVRTGGWVGPRAGLDVCKKSRPHRYSTPGTSSS